MTTDSLPLYEGLFLFSLNELAGRLAPAVEHLQDILQRAGAKVEALYKWDERKLAYEIRGNKRGLYLLAYFRAPGQEVARIERSVNLSESILRCLILRADHLGEVELEQARKLQAQTMDALALDKAGQSAPASAGKAKAQAPAAASESTDDSPATQQATEPADQPEPTGSEPTGSEPAGSEPAGSDAVSDDPLKTESVE